MQDMLHLLRLEFDETPPPGSKSLSAEYTTKPSPKCKESCGHAMRQSAKDPSHTLERYCYRTDFATQEPVRRKHRFG